MYFVRKESAQLQETKSPQFSDTRQWLMEIRRRVWYMGIAVLLTAATPATMQAELIAEDDSAVASYETPETIDVLSNDDTGSDLPDPTTVTIIAQPLHGSVSVDSVSGAITYTPEDRFAGSDSFQYSVEDETGTYSGSASVDVDVSPPDPPEILTFTVTEGSADVWIFAGTVSYDHPEDLTIDFGDLLAGHSVAVNADGTFSYSLILDNGEEGLVSATTTDEHGQASNEVFNSVDRT